MDKYFTSFRETISLRGLTDHTVKSYSTYIKAYLDYLSSVPSEEQVWPFISSMSDLKQKTMVTVMYSAGLRIGEVCRLRYEDIDRKNMRIHITHILIFILFPYCNYTGAFFLNFFYIHTTFLNTFDHLIQHVFKIFYIFAYTYKSYFIIGLQ